MTRDNPEERLEAPADFAGPIANRGCTDVLCTLLLLAMWVGMTALGVYSIQNGDVDLVTNPMDYSGNLCGVNNEGRNGSTEADMTDYPYLYYVNSALTGVCVKTCPDLNPDNAANESSVDFTTLVTYDGLFQLTDRDDDQKHAMAASAIEVADYSSSPYKQTCDQNACYPGADLGFFNATLAFAGEGINFGFGYAFFAVDTDDFLNRCVPKLDAVAEVLEASGVDETFDFLNQFPFFESFFGDLWRAKAWILGFGFPVSFVMGFAYLFVLGLSGLLSIVVWGSILLTNALFYFAGWYLLSQANAWEDEDPLTKEADIIQYTKIGSYVIFALAGLYTLFTCYIRKEIQLSLGTVKEAAKAVEQMPAITLFPILECAGFITFFIVWMYYALWMASLGDTRTKIMSTSFSDITYPSREFVYDDMIVGFGWYHLFCLFWTYEFIIALGQIIVAMSVAKWYFTRDKSEINSLTVISSIRKSLFFHAGTAAFGGLILAIISIIRAIIAKLQHEAKKTENKVAECIACSCSCCFYCLDKCVRFLNKHAYIQTAIFGTSFCTSSKEAFFLVLRNALKLGTLHYVSAIVVGIGKLFITVVTTLSCYALMDHFDAADYLKNIESPTVLVAVLSYIVADTFLDIFDFGVTTVLVCFLADDEMFEEGEAFADGSLKTLIDDWGK